MGDISYNNHSNRLIYIQMIDMFHQVTYFIIDFKEFIHEDILFILVKFHRNQNLYFIVAVAALY